MADTKVANTRMESQGRIVIAGGTGFLGRNLAKFKFYDELTDLPFNKREERLLNSFVDESFRPSLKSLKSLIASITTN